MPSSISANTHKRARWDWWSTTPSKSLSVKFLSNLRSTTHQGLARNPCYPGGPVQTDRGFILHRPTGQKWESTQTISNDISLTASKDIIPDIARERGPHDLIIALGYSGWGPGQLEEELANNAWLTVPADADIVFNVPFDQRAGAAAAKIGIDLNQLSVNAGHA